MAYFVFLPTDLLPKVIWFFCTNIQKTKYFQSNGTAKLWSRAAECLATLSNTLLLYADLCSIFHWCNLEQTDVHSKCSGWGFFPSNLVLQYSFHTKTVPWETKWEIWALSSYQYDITKLMRSLKTICFKNTQILRCPMNSGIPPYWCLRRDSSVRPTEQVKSRIFLLCMKEITTIAVTKR